VHAVSGWKVQEQNKCNVDDSSAVGLASLALPRKEMLRHFDSDSAVALARFRKHVAPALTEIP